jgi:hypothetical protein
MATTSMASHQYDVLSARGAKNNEGRRRKYLRNVCKANPSSALCRHESGPFELEVISRQQFDLIPAATPSISPTLTPTSTPTIPKGAVSTGASSEPSVSPSPLEDDSRPSSSGGPVFPSGIGSLAPSVSPFVQQPSDQDIPGPESPLINVPSASGFPSNQDIPGPEFPSIDPSSAIGAPSMSMIPSTNPTFEFPSSLSREPIGIKDMAPSDELKTNDTMSRNAVPAYAWVLIVCIPIILTGLVIAWWMQRVQKINIIQLQKLDHESDVTYDSDLPLTPIKPRALLLRPPSGEEERSHDEDDGDIEDGDTTDEDSDLSSSSSSSESELESKSKGPINPTISGSTDAYSTDSYESESETLLAEPLGERNSPSELLANDPLSRSLSSIELELDPPEVAEASSLLAAAAPLPYPWLGSSNRPKTRRQKIVLGQSPEEADPSGVV